MLRDLPARARWYIVSVIAVGAFVFCLLIRHAQVVPVGPLVFLAILSSLTSAFKAQFPIASGSNMSVSYVIDITALLLRGPDTSMLVSAASGWSQTTLNVKTRNPVYRTLFNIAILVVTVQTAGRVYAALGGHADADVETMIVPIVAMAVTYFLVNTVPIAIAIALTTDQSSWRVWKSDFASSAPSYLLGAMVAAVITKVMQSSGYWMTLLLTSAPLYLTYKMYRAGVESEARQGAILEAAHDAILTIDSSLNIREFNPAAEEMFGYARIDILGKKAELLLSAADRSSVLGALADYLKTGRGPLAGRQLELRGQRADGAEFPLELSVARMGADRSIELAAFVRDITERHALEEQLRQSQKLEAVGRLASGVAHDFNNILMSIMGAADVLLMQLSREDPARDEAGEIKQSVVRGAGLTRQLLAFSRRQATRPQLFALAEVVSGMETLLRRLIGPEIDLLITAVDGPGGPVQVHADMGQIEQVVMNLVINARDAMPSGGRLVLKIDEVTLDESAASALAEGKPGRYARLSVADTGTGIDDQTRARLFEPFFTTKEQGKGTGLGLSIVYGIVRQSGGYIAVHSAVGRGATFVLYFPAITAPQPAPVPA
ncbi:MAG TPA: PAS domain S-box protein [Vicinamibacterales bacterium]|nr:PAS domain S-box protein [Vicinamibacterales bacterium]